jgi:hypothetical protein
MLFTRAGAIWRRLRASLHYIVYPIRKKAGFRPPVRTLPPRRAPVHEMFRETQPIQTPAIVGSFSSYLRCPTYNPAEVRKV